MGARSEPTRDCTGGVMAGRLKVDPVDLHLSSDHMGMHHADLSTAHAAANGAIEEAQRGWVGSSARALQAKFVEWQAATSKITGELAAHGRAFQTAASGYVTSDCDGAERLTGTL
jgi:WXG100 family type VII secretion target